VVFFSHRFEELSSAHPITLKTAIFFDPIATFTVIRCDGFLYAPAVVIPNGQFQFIVQGFDETGLETLFIEGPHFGLVTPEPPTTELGTSRPETSEPETFRPETSEPKQIFTLTENRVRPQNLTILRRQSARIVLTLHSALSANRTRFTVSAGSLFTSFGLRVRARPRRFVLEPGSSRNIILRVRVVRRTVSGFQPIVVQISSSVQQLTYTNQINVLTVSVLMNEIYYLLFAFICQ